jgi:hypothetical protein
VEEIGRLQVAHIQMMEKMEQGHLLEINELQLKIKQARASVQAEIEAERSRCQILMQKLEQEVRVLESEKDETAAKLRISQEELESVLDHYRQLEHEVNSREDDHRVSRLQAEYDAELMEKDQRLFHFHEENQMLIKQLQEMEAHLESAQHSHASSNSLNQAQGSHSDDQLLMEIDRLQRVIIDLKEQIEELTQ